MKIKTRVDIRIITDLAAIDTRNHGNASQRDNDKKSSFKQTASLSVKHLHPVRRHQFHNNVKQNFMNLGNVISYVLRAKLFMIIGEIKMAPIRIALITISVFLYF